MRSNHVERYLVVLNQANEESRDTPRRLAARWVVNRWCSGTMEITFRLLNSSRSKEGGRVLWPVIGPDDHPPLPVWWSPARLVAEVPPSASVRFLELKAAR